MKKLLLSLLLPLMALPALANTDTTIKRARTYVNTNIRSNVLPVTKAIHYVSDSLILNALDSVKANSGTSATTTWTNGTRPASPTEPSLGYNTTTHVFEFYNGTNWQVFTSVAGVNTYTPVQSNFADAGPSTTDGAYTRRNSYAQLQFSTSATSVEVQVESNFFATYGSAAQFYVYVNGTLQTITINQGAAKWYTVTVPSGTNTIIVYTEDGLRPGGSGSLVGGNITGVRVNGIATFQTVTAPANRFVICGNSITVAGSTGWTLLFRSRLQTSGRGRVTVDGNSANSLTEEVNTSLKLTAFVSRLGAYFDGTDTNTLLITLGTNDLGLSKCNSAQFQIYVDSFADRFHSAYPNVRFYWLTLFTRTDGPSADSQAAFRSAITTSASFRSSWFHTISGPDMMSATPTFLDGLHPDAAEHVVIEQNIASAYGLTGIPTSSSYLSFTNPALQNLLLPTLSNVYSIGFLIRSSTNGNAAEVLLNGSDGGSNTCYISSVYGQNSNITSYYADGTSYSASAFYAGFQTGGWKKVYIQLDPSLRSLAMSYAMMGRLTQFAGNYYGITGDLRDLRIYNRVWTSGEKADATTTLPGAGIIARYDFAAVSGTTVPDVSGNSHTATYTH